MKIESTGGIHDLAEEAIAGLEADSRDVAMPGNGNAGVKTASIGEITSCAGHVFAESSDGSLRSLGPGDSLFRGDVVRTEYDSMAILSFRDGSRRGLGSNAELVLQSAESELTVRPCPKRSTRAVGIQRPDSKPPQVAGRATDTEAGAGNHAERPDGYHPDTPYRGPAEDFSLQESYAPLGECAEQASRVTVPFPERHGAAPPPADTLDPPLPPASKGSADPVAVVEGSTESPARPSETPRLTLLPLSDLDLAVLGAEAPVVLAAIAALEVAGGVPAPTDAPGGMQTIDGLYGTLTLDPDGSYGYRLTGSGELASSALRAGGKLQDIFAYQVTGGPAQASLPTLLTIDVGSACQGLPEPLNPADEPIAECDTPGAGLADPEASDPQQALEVSLVSLSELDLAALGAEAAMVREAIVALEAADGVPEPVAVTGGAQTVAGRYGELQLEPDGTYAYSLCEDGEQALAQLPTGDTLQDVFAYRVTGGSEQDSPPRVLAIDAGAVVAGPASREAVNDISSNRRQAL